MIYLDSAATSYYRPPQVAQAVAWAIENLGNSSRGVHPLSLAAGRIILETRELLCQLFHGPGPEQVAFTANATESLNMAIKGLLEPGDQVLTTVREHNSVLRPLYEMEAKGVSLKIAENMDELEDQIRPGIRAVVCTHASNVTGDLTDLRRIGEKTRAAGALLIADASQTAGIFPIDMEKDCIDILCFTGHKGLMGPQGTGGICLSKDVHLRPLVTGGSGIMTFSPVHPQIMPAALEAGTLNSHGIAGLRAALLYIKGQGMERIRRKEQRLAWAFYQQVSQIPGIHVYGDFSTEERAPIVSLNLGDEDSSEICDYLVQEHQIYTRSGGHCAPLLHQALGTREQGAVRFSFSHFNTMEQVEKAVWALKDYS